MPTTMTDREQAFEAQFAHNEDFRFRVAARRDKLLAKWAAAKIRLSDAASAELVRAVLAIPDGPGHDAALVARVAEAFPGLNTRPSAADLSVALAHCEGQARQQLLEPSDVAAAPI